jgi:hypothetical protein
MSEIIERGDYRAVIEHDAFASKPEGCFFATVYQMTDPGVSILGQDECVTQDFRDEIVNAWTRYGDMRKVERYLRMFHGVIGFDYIDYPDSKMINVVTLADLQHWGYTGLETYRVVTGNDDPSAGNLDEWREWAEGNTYYVSIEKRETHYHEHYIDGELVFAEDKVTWEQIDHSGNIYGIGSALQSAEDELSGLTSDDENV